MSDNPATPPPEVKPEREDDAAIIRLLDELAHGSQPAKTLWELGRRFANTGVFDLAYRCFVDAARRLPDSPSIQRSLGLALCRRGEIAKGLQLYEARWQLEEFKPALRKFPHPPWRGEPLAGKRILLWAEQGVGDQLMHARCLAPMLAAGARVTFEGDPRLFPLLERSFRGVEWVAQAGPPAPELMRRAFDFQCSLLTAWRWTMPPTLSAWTASPYLVPDEKLVARYRETWRRRGWNRNIGLSWRSKSQQTGPRKSMPLALLQPLLADRRLTFHSLQYGADRGELGALRVMLDADGDALNNLDRLAAQIKALDLVISISNSTVHLAGAMAVPCWVMVAAGSDWRWGERGDTTPFYRAMRLIRQAHPGSWDDVLVQLHLALADWAPATA